MAKQKTGKGAKKPKAATAKAAKKTGAARKAAAKKKAAKKSAQKPLLAIDAMPEARQASIYDAVQQLLTSRGVKGQLMALHLDTDIQALLCQPPKVRRMICRKENGIVRCAPECVDP